MAEEQRVSKSLEELCKSVAKNDPSLDTVQRLSSYDSGEKMGDHGLTALASALATNTNIKGLILCQNDISAVGARALFQVLIDHETSVEHVSLRQNKVGQEEEAAVEALSLVGQTGLLKLILTDNEISGMAAAALATSIRQHGAPLQLLYLGSNPIGNRGATAFGETLESSNLQLTSLLLAFCDIQDEGASALARGINKNNSVVEFALNGNQVGNDGATDIAKNLRFNESLKELLLFDNRIDAEGHRVLIQEGLRHNVSLESLRLGTQPDGALQDEKLCYIRLNKAGRRMLRHEKAHASLWANVLSKKTVRNDQDLVFYFVSANPQLFIR